MTFGLKIDENAQIEISFKLFFSTAIRIKSPHRAIAYEEFGQENPLISANYRQSSRKLVQLAKTCLELVEGLADKKIQMRLPQITAHISIMAYVFYDTLVLYSSSPGFSVKDAGFGV